jgi:hypothetical protein
VFVGLTIYKALHRFYILQLYNLRIYNFVSILMKASTLQRVVAECDT